MRLSRSDEGRTLRDPDHDPATDARGVKFHPRGSVTERDVVDEDAFDGGASPISCRKATVEVLASRLARTLAENRFPL